MFKVSKRQNAVCLGLAVAAMVAIFFYQVAYGISTIIGPTGTATVTGPNGITGTLTAPPGSIVKNMTITVTNHTYG